VANKFCSVSPVKATCKFKAIAHNRNTISDQVLWQAFNRFDGNAYNVKPETH